MKGRRRCETRSGCQGLQGAGKGHRRGTDQSRSHGGLPGRGDSGPSRMRDQHTQRLPGTTAQTEPKTAMCARSTGRRAGQRAAGRAKGRGHRAGQRAAGRRAGSAGSAGRLTDGVAVGLSPSDLHSAWAADQLRAAGRRGWTGRSGLGPDTRRWDSRWDSWGLRPGPCGTRTGCSAGHRGRRPGPCRSGRERAEMGGVPQSCRQRSAGPGPDPREGAHPASPEEHAWAKQTVPAELQFQKPVYHEATSLTTHSILLVPFSSNLIPH